ncbi:uncharacterized protein HD556DRAFT_1446710 [Suillus plorans]|uniref:Condensin complex subunit 1 C-terminal domain-containing protein n=1 Tax=Suillus plorans TaxID=116603 RepID=A0A9P7AHP0_9AGAM|nr:uncharacterized protein HD556DRAFT_1446710 [Suillus plorans]KAG1789697.1 hypothetical protein HD556DRAFT_1446710 [Suillus plorans]
MSMGRPPRKGENYELSVDLNSEYHNKRQDAIKHVIVSMTVGKGATLSRLICSTCLTHPYRQEARALVHALAIRTMGCLRAEKIIDYLCDPLQRALQDDNPYVRKAIALWLQSCMISSPSLSSLWWVLSQSFLVASFSITINTTVPGVYATSTIPGVSGCYRSSSSYQLFIPFILFSVFELGAIQKSVRGASPPPERQGWSHALVAMHRSPKACPPTAPPSYSSVASAPPPTRAHLWFRSTDSRSASHGRNGFLQRAPAYTADKHPED